MSAERLYLDHAATTPVVAEARAAIAGALAGWANPSSPHADGRNARAALEAARSHIADLLGWNGEVIFTGGATEAISMALLRAHADATLVSAIEHEAVHRSAATAKHIPVTQAGVVDLAHLATMLGAETALHPLVAVQQVNNETGAIQPVAEIAEMVRARGGLFFCDAAQGAGKMPLPDADFVAIAGHKIGAPPGIGALLVRDLAQLSATGGQEKGYRGGTENLPYVEGLSAALGAGYGWMENAARLRERLDEAIASAGGEIVASGSPRIATIASYRMPGVSASSQLIGFDLAGISVSAGSACSSGTLKTSPVLAAMGWDGVAASEVVRVSFGPTTGAADIDRFLGVWLAIKDRAGAA